MLDSDVSTVRDLIYYQGGHEAWPIMLGGGAEQSSFNYLGCPFALPMSAFEPIFRSTKMA